MNISLTFKNFEPSDHLRHYATRRFEKLGRFVHNAENVEMTVVLNVDKFRHKADVQFISDAVKVSAEEESSDMYATVDKVLDKLGTQLKKHSERMKEKRRSRERDAMPAGQPFLEETDAEQLILEVEQVEPKPLFVDEAAMQFEQRKDDEVLVFFNADTSRINVLYRRRQGGFGLIDPGV